MGGTNKMRSFFLTPGDCITKLVQNCGSSASSHGMGKSIAFASVHHSGSWSKWLSKSHLASFCSSQLCHNKWNQSQKAFDCTKAPWSICHLRSIKYLKKQPIKSMEIPRSTTWSQSRLMRSIWKKGTPKHSLFLLLKMISYLFVHLFYYFNIYIFEFLSCFYFCYFSIYINLFSYSFNHFYVYSFYLFWQLFMFFDSNFTPLHFINLFLFIIFIFLLFNFLYFNNFLSLLIYIF